MGKQTFSGTLTVCQGGREKLKIHAKTILASYPYTGYKAAYFCTGISSVTGSTMSFSGGPGSASAVIGPGTRVPQTGSSVKVEDVKPNRLAGTERQINVYIK